MTGERYSLQFHAEEIRVVDHDNADEPRISDTLSGGETFLTSLALALEFSDQVQRAVGAVSLDSLFIDEVFGTLDPDTLALVAETLQGLRVGGRMVGIITHIPELRDEFAQQVIVTQAPGLLDRRGPRAGGAGLRRAARHIPCGGLPGRRGRRVVAAEDLGGAGRASVSWYPGRP